MKIKIDSTLIAILIVIGSVCAHAQQSEGEREEAAQAETKRLEAMIDDIGEEAKNIREATHNLGDDTNLRARRIMETCQRLLPELDNAFRIEMLYAPANLKPGFQLSYIETRGIFSISLSWHK
jgi:hypothetical protein